MGRVGLKRNYEGSRDLEKVEFLKLLGFLS